MLQFAARFTCLMFALVNMSTLYALDAQRSALTKMAMDIPVRILLEENPLNKTNWTLKSKNGFVVYSPQNLSSKVIKKNKLSVTYKEGSLYLDTNKTDQQDLFILPIDGLIGTASTEYDGYFALKCINDKAYLINHVDIEEYLASVLPHEGYSSWPEEFHKALCIACRSYALAEIYRRRDLKLPHPYDVKNSVLDQVYKGHQRTVLRKVVYETKGMILAHNDKPILAMYSSVCGGVIPAHNTNRDPIFKKEPYLKRSYACTHCKGHRYYRWNSTCQLSELEPKLKKVLPGLDTLKDIKIDSYNAAGVPHKVLVKGSEKWFPMNIHNFRKVCHTVKSHCSTLSTHDGTLHMSGKGYGHHLGLCQWGAYDMVKKGHTYQEVLSFYYPNTSLIKL